MTRKKNNPPRWRKTSQHTERDPGTARAPSKTSDTLATANASSGADISDLFDVLSRQRYLIVTIVGACLLAGVVALSLLTPRYTATAQLIIDLRRPSLPALEAVLPGLTVDNQSIISETAVLQSRILLGAVVEQTGLEHDAEFNSALRPPGAIDRFRAWLGLSNEPETPREHGNARFVDALLSRLQVAQVPNSRVIAVSVTSESPDKATTITNALVDEYLASQQRAKLLATTEASAWLNERIGQLQAELLESEKRVEEFRSGADLLQAQGTTLVAQQIADLNGQLIATRTATGAASARLEQLASLINNPEGSGIMTANEVLQSPLIQNLRQQQVVVERRIAELSSEFGRSHPIMIQLRADAEDLNNQITIEVDKIAQGLRNELSIAQAKERALGRQLAELSGRMTRMNENEIELRALERESEANRQLLETLLSRQKEIGSPDDVLSLQSDARVISYAARPNGPSFPQKGFSMGIVFVMSSLLALVVAFVREIRQRGYMDTDQLEAATKLTALGFIPLVSARVRKRNMLMGMIENPRLPFAQALKAINWQLDDIAPKPCRTILITSSIASEGKTTTAIGLARTKALDGHKTLLIDADIRKPSVHEQLGKPVGPGLREVLENDEPVLERIIYDQHTSLDVLTAGSPSPDPLSWLASQRMQRMLESLATKYDYVVIDSPPVVIAPDACALSQMADTTVMLVRWSRTPADVVKYALRMLRRNGGHVTGTIMTMLDASKQSRYVYGYYGAYGNYAQQTD